MAAIHISISKGDQLSPLVSWNSTWTHRTSSAEEGTYRSKVQYRTFTAEEFLVFHLKYLITELPFQGCVLLVLLILRDFSFHFFIFSANEENSTRNSCFPFRWKDCNNLNCIFLPKLCLWLKFKLWIYATLKGMKEQPYSQCAFWHIHPPALPDAISQLTSSFHVEALHGLHGLSGSHLRLL